MTQIRHTLTFTRLRARFHDCESDENRIGFIRIATVHHLHRRRPERKNSCVYKPSITFISVKDSPVQVVKPPLREAILSVWDLSSSVWLISKDCALGDGHTKDQFTSLKTPSELGTVHHFRFQQYRFFVHSELVHFLLRCRNHNLLHSLHVVTPLLWVVLQSLERADLSKHVPTWTHNADVLSRFLCLC